MAYKKIGIVCDDYKVEKFKEVLNDKGFRNFKVVKDRPKDTFITVKVKEKEIPKIRAICELVEAHFKQQN